MDLVGPAGVVLEAVDDLLDVRLGVRVGLAVVPRLDGREKGLVAEAEVGELAHQVPTLGAGDEAPGLEGGACGDDGDVDVLGRGGGDDGDLGFIAVGVLSPGCTQGQGSWKRYVGLMLVMVPPCFGFTHWLLMKMPVGCLYWVPLGAFRSR